MFYISTRRALIRYGFTSKAALEIAINARKGEKFAKNLIRDAFCTRHSK